MVKRASLTRRYREFRESQGWSLRDLQGALGIHRQTWSKWELEKQSPAAASIVLLLALERAKETDDVANLVAHIGKNSRWLSVDD